MLHGIPISGRLGAGNLAEARNHGVETRWVHVQRVVEHEFHAEFRFGVAVGEDGGDICAGFGDMDGSAGGSGRRVEANDTDTRYHLEIELPSTRTLGCCSDAQIK